MQGMASIHHPLQKLNALNHQSQQQQLIQSSHLQVPPSSHLDHVASYDSFNFLEQSHGVGFLPTSWSDGQLQQGFEQIGGSSPAPDMKAVSLQQQMLSGLLRHSHGHDSGGENKVESLYNIPGRCLTQPPLTNLQQQQQQFQQFHGTNDAMAGAAAIAAVPKQKVRAKRGQATDPHSIAERLRRERITERVKALQELVPHANKSDRAVMLDEVIEYVKFLRLQVKVLSMSRMGCAGAIAPFFLDVPPYEAASGVTQQTAGTTTNESVTAAEDKVAELMEEDMGSAMQYIQGKGLCLMPIALASTISSATCGPGARLAVGGAESPSSPSLSALTVQSAIAHGGAEI